MRLIDADAFKAEGRELYRVAGWDLREVHYSQMDVECNIDNMPTIEAEPVKHGHWIEKIIYSHSYAECSECKTVYSWSETETMRFCKRCGAKMNK